MKQFERFILVAIIAVFAGGAWWLYDSTTERRADYRARVAAGEFEIVQMNEVSTTTDKSNWREYYPVVYSMQVGEVAVRASVADTLSERLKGLSNTPFLPDDMVKLFAFGASGPHSIWMKDMNYALDILWADQSGVIVHIEENISPDTYDADNTYNSKTYASPVPAWFVIEANAGFAEEHGVEKGDQVVLPE